MLAPGRCFGSSPLNVGTIAYTCRRPASSCRPHHDNSQFPEIRKMPPETEATLARGIGPKWESSSLLAELPGAKPRNCRAFFRRAEIAEMAGLAGWGGRIRTSVWRKQNPLPYCLEFRRTRPRSRVQSRYRPCASRHTSSGFRRGVDWTSCRNGALLCILPGR